MRDSRILRSSVFMVLVTVLCFLAIQQQKDGLSTDFPSFYTASGSLARGENPYDLQRVSAYARECRIDGVVYPYLYPPFLASVISPMTSLSPERADRVWGAIMVLMFALAALLVALIPPTKASDGRAAMRPVLEVALAVGILLILPLAQNFSMGQVNALVAACMTIAILGAEREGQAWQWGAGAALGVAALIKVTPALLVLMLLARKKTTCVWSFLATGAVGVGLSVAISGTEVWGQFLAFVPHTVYGKSIEGMFHPIVVANVSLSAFFMRVAEGSGPVVRLISMLSALLLLWVLLWAVVRYRDAVGRQGLLLALLIVMVVVSPYTWIHHLVFLYPGLFLMFRDLLGRAHFQKPRRLLVLSSLLLLGLTRNFPESYPFMEIPEVVRPFVTSLNLFFLLGLFAVSLRWASYREVAPVSDHARRSLGGLLPRLLPARVRAS